MSPSVSIRKRAGLALPALAAMVGGLVLATPLSAAAPSVSTFSITVSDATVQIGDTVDVTVTATTAVDVYAYELLLGFDPAVLDYVDGSAETAISGQSGESVEGDGLQFVHTKLGTSPSAAGDLTLVTLSFEAIGAGDVSLILDAELVGADAVSLAVTDAASAEVIVTAPAAPVGPVTPPVPSAPGTPAGSPVGEGSDSSSGPNRDSLSETGTNVAPWPIIGSVAALLLGAALVIGVRLKRAQH